MSAKRFDVFADWSWFERLWLLSFTLITVYLFFALDDTVIGLLERVRS